MAMRYSHARNRAVAVEPVPMTPRPQECLLYGVVGLVERGQHPVAVDVQLPAVPLGGGGERCLVDGERHAPGSVPYPTSWRTQLLPSGSAKSAKEL